LCCWCPTRHSWVPCPRTLGGEGAGDAYNKFKSYDLGKLELKEFVDDDEWDTGSPPAAALEREAFELFNLAEGVDLDETDCETLAEAGGRVMHCNEVALLQKASKGARRPSRKKAPRKPTAPKGRAKRGRAKVATKGRPRRKAKAKAQPKASKGRRTVRRRTVQTRAQSALAALATQMLDSSDDDSTEDEGESPSPKRARRA